MLDVTLIRHGQSVSNTQKRFGSQADIPLSPVGRLQAALTGDALAPLGVTRILSSDLVRAADTARAIGERTGAPVEVRPELRERDVGVLTGLTFEEARRQHPRVFADLHSGDPRRVIGGGESYFDVARRVDRLLRPIFAQERGHVVVVGHMMVLQHLLRMAVGADESNLKRVVSFGIKNAALHRLRYDHGRRHWHVLGLNEAWHLRSVEADDSLTPE